MSTKKLWISMIMLSTLSLKGQEFILTDAQRFARLFQQYPDSLPAQILEAEYLSVGTPGIKIFTPNRIVNATNLAKRISQNRAAYQKGIEVMLEGALLVEEESIDILKRIQALFKQKKSAPAYLLFGANNSGGTASGKGLVIGLEVLARFAETPNEAKEVIKSFVAHEIVHVYQRRVRAVPGRNYLLTQCLKEGFADFVARLILGYVPSSEVARHAYGMVHEDLLWQEFQEDMNGTEFQPWMYGKGKGDRPSDLGYWIGLRICEAYYSQAEDKEAALQTLLKLKRPLKILEESGYDPKG